MCVALGLSQVSSVDPLTDESFPQFTIALNKKYDERFVEVAQHFREEIIVTAELFVSNVPQFAVDLFDYTYWIWWFIDHKQYEEIKGIVRGVNSPRVTLPRTILINTIYELGAYCTSIIAQTTNGTIIHSRNLDFDAAE